MKYTRPREGVGSLDNGAAFYQSCLKYYLTVDMSADDVHQLGLDEVDRIAKLMENVTPKFRLNLHCSFLTCSLIVHLYAFMHQYGV